MTSLMKQVRLGDVCRIVPGFAFKSRDWSAHGVPVVKIKNIRGDGTVDLAEADHIPLELVTPKLSQFLLRDCDILIAMTGATAGKVGKLRTDKTVLLNQRVAKIEPEAADPRYIWAIVSSTEYQRIFFRLADGAAQPNMSGKQIEGVLLPLPPPQIQSRIGAILGAYDDLIEVNRRRIALLEEMARRLFDEWFVQLRFPGSNVNDQYEAARGLLPNGWKSLPFTSVAEVLSGGTPKKSNEQYWGGNIPFFTPRDAPDTSWIFETAATVTENGVRHCNSQIYPAKTVFITARGTVGKLALAGVPMAMNQSCYALQGLGYPQYFLLEFSRHAVSELKQMSSGAVFDAIIVDTFARLPRRAPPLDLAFQFERIVEPMFLEAGNLICSNSKLVASRDNLLPRLVSGTLSVSTAERELADAA